MHSFLEAMSTSISVQAFFVSLILAQLPTLGITELLGHLCINEQGNFTTNSAYQANIDRLFSSFSTITTNDYGFYNISEGQDSDKVNAISLCRGDVSPDACLDCININATTQLRGLCPQQKEAIIWYDYCMLRYSNRPIFGILETGPDIWGWNENNVSDVQALNSILNNLLNNLSSKAASGDSRRKFAVGQTPGGSAFQTLYALVQCTPDLSERQCRSCLSEVIRQLPMCCDRRIGGKVLGPSCNFRYEINSSFYNLSFTGDAPPPASPLSPPPPDDPTNNKVLIIVIPALAFVILICCCLFIFLRRTKPKHRKLSKAEVVDDIVNVESLQYELDTIIAATEDFSEENKLGEGGFGVVYKGTLDNGEEVAVKRLSVGSGQGDLEFKNEVQLVARLQHRNLVRLRGFCLDGNERILIYEFVPNASLDKFLFDPLKRTLLDWETRLKIIGGIARGLVYLHEDSRLRIIHRDLKASNILLDAEMNPKISDFGTARLFELEQTQDETKRPVGTFGYMAPEYVKHGNFSMKSDVYSFGVLVLEIVNGQKNKCSSHGGQNTEDLLTYTWRNWREGTALNVIDPTMRDGSTTEILRCIHIGLLCVQENVADRPTMGSVILMLTSHSASLPIPLKPGYFMHSSGFSSSGSRNGIAEAASNDVTITELNPR